MRDLLICSSEATYLLYQLSVVKVLLVGQQGHVLGGCGEVVRHLVRENCTSFHLIEFLADRKAVVKSEMDFILFLFYGLARAPCLGSAGKADANASAGASYRSELCRAQLLMWDSLRCNFGFGRGGLRASCPNSCITALLIHLGSWQIFHGHDQTSHRLARTWAVHPCWAGHWIQSWFTF